MCITHLNIPLLVQHHLYRSLHTVCFLLKELSFGNCSLNSKQINHAPAAMHVYLFKIKAQHIIMRVKKL